MPQYLFTWRGDLLNACALRLTALRACLSDSLCRCWWALRRHWRSAPVEVLVADRSRRRALERELRRGLRRLQGALSAPLPADLAVVVQQVLVTDRQLAGCYQLGLRPDGSRFALARLALQVNGRTLSTDELLAALADVLVGLAVGQCSGPSVLVPINLEPCPPVPTAEARRPTALRPDPLAPQPGGDGLSAARAA